MAKNRQKIKKFNKKLSFWDRESKKKVGNKFQDIDKIGAKE